jgi:hypothetical protein
MTGDIFLKWLKIVKFVKQSKEKNVLLLVDDHGSHKDLNVLTFAKQHGILIFCFPPHRTHIQPLDVSFYGPLRTYYNQQLNDWLRNHPGRVITHYQVAGIFKVAYNKAATIENAEKGLSSTEICPFNDKLFPEWMFCPSEVTDIDINDRSRTLQPSELELERRRRR